MTRTLGRCAGAAPLAATFARLRGVAPAAAVTAAEAALDVALAPTLASPWAAVVWRGSRLTNTGFPVEFSWSSRWTAEASGPESEPHERLGAAQALLGRLGAEIEVPGWLRPRPGHALRFGAWAGGRHDGREDRYKLYVETAGDGPAPVLLPDPVARVLPGRVAWRMAGIDGSGVELYARLAHPEGWEVERLFAACGLDPAPVVRLARRLRGGAGRERLLPGTAGLSLALRGGRVVAAGLFVHASPIVGSDVVARATLVARSEGWPTVLYEALAGGEGGGPVRHGIIGFGVDREGAGWMQVGLRPC